MANKLIQLNDGTDNLFPQLPTADGYFDFTSSTTLSQIGSIQMPTGLKLLRVRLQNRSANPLQMVLTDNANYEKDGNISANGTKTTQYLSLTVLTDVTEEYVFSKWDAVGSNRCYYKYVLLSTN